MESEKTKWGRVRVVGACDVSLCIYFERVRSEPMLLERAKLALVFTL